MERRIEKHSTRLSAALDQGFHVGERVRTLDGLTGRVIMITESFAPGNSAYQIVLDNGQGGGTYLASQLRPVPEDYGGGHQAPAYLPAGVTAALETEAELQALASDDYPEMGSILHDRPDPGGQITVIGAIQGHGLDPFAMAMHGLSGDDARYMSAVIDHIRQNKGQGVPIDAGDAELMARSMRGRDRMEQAGYQVSAHSKEMRFPRGFAVDVHHNHRLHLVPERDDEGQTNWYARIVHAPHPMGPKIEHTIRTSDEDLPAAVSRFLDHPDTQAEMEHQREEGRRIHEEIRAEGHLKEWDDPDAEDHNTTWCHVCGEHHDSEQEADEHDSAHTDWDEYYPGLPSHMHRGMTLELGVLDHRAVHDHSQPLAHRAEALRQAVQYGRLGGSWTPDADQAHHYTEVSAHGRTHNYAQRDPSLTQVIFHALKPAREDIETDPYELAGRQVLGFDKHEDSEIPLKDGAPVSLTGVSWKRHDEDGYHHYDFDGHQGHLAAFYGTDEDPREQDYNGEPGVGGVFWGAPAQQQFVDEELGQPQPGPVEMTEPVESGEEAEPGEEPDEAPPFGAQASLRDDKSDRWHEYGQQYRPDTLHRGVHVRLDPDVHDYVHDESVPRAERARVLLDNAHRFGLPGLGQHWTPHISIAHRAISNAADASEPGEYDDDPEYNIDDWMEDHYHGGDDEEHEPRHTHTDVIFHARRPGRRNEIREPKQMEQHGVGWRFSPDEHETFLREGSPLRIEGISWKLHEPEYPNEPYEHVDFDRPVRHTAGAARPGPYYHGTVSEFSPGDELTPEGARDAYGASSGGHVYLSRSKLSAAAWALTRAGGGGSPRIYEVRPWHEPEPDPNHPRPEDDAWRAEGATVAREVPWAEAQEEHWGKHGSVHVKHARVPWTPEQRALLHSWQEHPTATAGDFVPSSQFTNDEPEYAPGPDPEMQFAEAVGPRAFTEMTARLAAHAPHGQAADEVYRQLSGKFPPDAISWVHDAQWEGPHRVPLGQVDFSNRDSWEAQPGDKKVRKFKKKITKKEDAGKDPKPAILISKPGRPGQQTIADGHHRAIAEEELEGEDPGREGLYAWTAHVPEDEGPWDQMHSAQESDQGDALDEPGEETGPPGADADADADSLEFGDPGAAQPVPPMVTTGLPPYSQGGTPGPRTRNYTPVEQSPSFLLAHPELQQQNEPPPGDEDDPGDPGEGDDGDKGKALDALEKSAGSASFRFEFTASWADVVAKARRILGENGVRITMLAGSMTVGEVKGDHATYETGLQYYPGRGFSVMAYSCGCPWATFWQNPDQPGRFAGRMCSHAYALGLAARARGVVRRTMFPDLAGWPEEVVTKSEPPWHPSDKQWAWQTTAPMTRVPVLSSLISGSLDEQVSAIPAVTAARVLVGAGEDPAAVTTLLRLAGMQVVSDQANAPWGSQDVASTPPAKPYGATSPPEKDQDPGSYGFLSGPDPDNWGEIQEDSAIQQPLTNEAARRSDDPNVLDTPDSLDWADDPGQSLAYQDPGSGLQASASGAIFIDNQAGWRPVPAGSDRYGNARQGTGPVLDTEASRVSSDLQTMDTNTGPVTRDWGESFPPSDQAPAAGLSTSIEPRDPQGIRMEEALARLRALSEAALKTAERWFPDREPEPEPQLQPQRARPLRQLRVMDRPAERPDMSEFEFEPEPERSHGGGDFPPVGEGMGGGGGGDGDEKNHFHIIRNQPGHFGLINSLDPDHDDRYTSYHHSAEEAIHMLGHLERSKSYEPHSLDYWPHGEKTRRPHDIGDQYIAHANRWFNAGHPDYNPHPDVPPTPRTEAELDEHWRQYHSSTPMNVKGARDDAHRLRLKQTMHDLQHGQTRMAPEFHLCPNKHAYRWDRTPGAERCEFESTGHTHMPPGLEDLFGQGAEQFMGGEGTGPTKYSALAEPQGEGALAELKDEPEPALDEEGLTASGLNPDVDLGYGSGDEPASPEEASIQTQGNQQWSGGDYSSGDLAHPEDQGQQFPAEDPDLRDIVAAFQRSAAARQYSGDGAIALGSGDIAAAARAHLQKEADVLPADEADELIREGRGTRARNLDLLDLSGTHYTDDPQLDEHDDDIAWA